MRESSRLSFVTKGAWVYARAGRRVRRCGAWKSHWRHAPSRAPLSLVHRRLGRAKRCRGVDEHGQGCLRRWELSCMSTTPDAACPELTKHSGPAPHMDRQRAHQGVDALATPRPRLCWRSPLLDPCLRWRATSCLSPHPRQLLMTGPWCRKKRTCSLREQHAMRTKFIQWSKILPAKSGQRRLASV